MKDLDRLSIDKAVDEMWGAIVFIRGIVNRRIKEYLIAEGEPLWNQFNSALNTITDTVLATRVYYQDDDDSGHPFVNYLYVYGLLQVLFVQQDAVKHLCESLNLKCAWNQMTDENLNILKARRDVRNKSIGHPTKKGGKNDISYHGITALSRDKLTVWSIKPDNTYCEEEIYPSQMIKEQAEILSPILITLRDHVHRLWMTLGD